MKKICIISPANLKYVPYVQNYLDFLRNNNCTFDIVSWNKSNLNEDVKYHMDYYVEDTNRFRMLCGYLRFGRFCRKIIKRNKYAKLVFLTIAPLFFCGKKISKKYKGKYILDIRDSSPLIKAFPKTFHSLLNNSFIVISSSWMFSSWIKHDFVLSHNVDIKHLLNHYNDSVICHYHKTKRIVFAGMMIEEKINIKLLDCFKNSDDLSFLYVGRDNAGKAKIVEYVKSNGFDNVAFEGTYNKNEIIDIYRTKADFVNILREKTEINRNAIPNKLYDSVVSGVPLIVFDHNEGISRVTKEYNLGIVLGENDFLSLRDLLESFDYQLYKNGRKRFLDSVLKDDEKFKNELSKFIDV